MGRLTQVSAVRSPWRPSLRPTYALVWAIGATTWVLLTATAAAGAGTLDLTLTARIDGTAPLDADDTVESLLVAPGRHPGALFQRPGGALHQIGQVEGFRKVIVGFRFGRLDRGHDRVLCGNDDHGQSGPVLGDFRKKYGSLR